MGELPPGWAALQDAEGGAWGPAALVDDIAAGGDDVLCHTPGRVFGYVDHAAARSLFVDGERLPFAPEAAPFVPLLCSNARLPPEVLQGPLQESAALRELVCELIRRDFLSVDILL